MSGKSKQSQRTKNNARPSSSGRSAELLNNAAIFDPSLGNVQASAVLPSLFSTLTVVSLDQGLNTEFSLCIKKLNKKDPITKTKALQELNELINNSKLEDVVAMLPSWVHFYKILSIHPDHKVREVTQVCHGSVMSVCGRRAAPHLKALVPAWLAARYDEYAPAAAAAKLALESTFPANKLSEVISFCKTEVIAYLLENLTGNADKDISKKIEDAEMREAHQIRLTTRSLQGLGYYTQHLASTHDDWLWGELAPLLQANVFWKYASHTSHQLRTAWYAAMSHIIQRFKDTFGNKYGQKTVRLLVASAKEQNPLVVSQLWTCLLLLMHNVKDWHTWLDKNDLLVKRILHLLQSGGWGDARHLADLLVPLLAHLPHDMLTKAFYETFFNALFTGFEKKTILSSKSERQSWITSVAECLRYLSVQQNDFVIEVSTSVHRMWLERVLSMPRDAQLRTNLIKCSATNMSSIVKYWLKQSQDENSEKYDQLVRNFWQNVGSTIVIQIDTLSTDRDEITKLVDEHTLLLLSLKTSFSQEAKKQHSIKFDGYTETVVGKSTVSNQHCDTALVDRYKHNLNELVEKVCLQYFEFANEKQLSNNVLTQLITLVIEFDSRNMFLALAKRFNVNTIYEFYEKVLRSWLSRDTMSCKPIVDIVFLLMKYLSEDEQNCLFDSFTQFPPAVVECCISVSLSHPHRSSPAARRWLYGASAGAHLLAVCRRLVRDGDGSSRNLLMMCLAHDADGKMIISNETVSEILATVSAAVSDVSSPALEQSAGFAAQLASTLAPDDVTEPFAKLVFNLFRLNLLVERGDSRLSVDTWCEVRASWQDGLGALAQDKRARAHADTVALIHTQLFYDKENLDIKKIDHIVSLCPYLLSHFNETQMPYDLTEITSFTKLLFDFKQISQRISVESYAYRYDCIEGNLNCPFSDVPQTEMISKESNGDVTELTKENLIVYVEKYLIRVTYLKAILLHKITKEDDEDEEVKREEKTWCNTLLKKEKYFQEEFIKILHDSIIINTLNECYAFWPHYEIIKQTKQRSDILLEDIINNTSIELKNEILITLFKLSTAKGYYWSYAEWFYRSKIQCDINKESLGSLDKWDSIDFKIEDLITGVGFFHNLQAMLKYSKDRKVHLRVKYLLMVRSFCLAHADEPDVVSVFVREALACYSECSLEPVLNAYYRHNHIMLYARELSDAPWHHVVSNAMMVDFLCELMDARAWDLPAYHWDFIIIAVCLLVTSIEKSKLCWGKTKVCMLTRPVLSLYSRVSQFMSEVPAESECRQPSEHVARMPTEWRDFFAPDLTTNLFLVLMHLLELTDPCISSIHISFIDALISCIPQLEYSFLPKSWHASELRPQRIVSTCALALQSPVHHSLKYLAHYLLGSMVGNLVHEDMVKLSLWSALAESSEADALELDESQVREVLSPAYFSRALRTLQELVATALSHLQVCEETCAMLPFTDSHGLALGYLSLVHALLRVIDVQCDDLPHHYIEMLREEKYAEPLMTICLRLLPASVAAVARDAREPRDLTPSPADTALFVDEPALTLKEPPSSSSIGALSCRCIYLALSGPMSAEVRSWWGAAGTRISQPVARLVRAYIAPALVTARINAMLVTHGLFDTDMEINVHWSTWEVVCVQMVEEHAQSLCVRFSREHPLQPPTVQPARPPAPPNHWFALYLAYQNGNLYKGFKMWVRTLHARIDRLPQCYICYCRLQPASGQLPRVFCRQCSNRFHTACLRKWFTISNKSNCPLCRSVM